MKVLALFVLCGFVAGISAHLCLLNPRQRGSMTGFNKPGAADCDLTMDDCGGRMKSSNNMAIFRRGMNYTVVFQKNLDHHNATQPGSFDVSLVQKATGRYFNRALASVPDTSDPSLTLYQVDVHIPQSTAINISPEYVMAVTYSTNTISVTFKQCADILLI